MLADGEAEDIVFAGEGEAVARGGGAGVSNCFTSIGFNETGRLGRYSHCDVVGNLSLLPELKFLPVRAGAQDS